MASLTRDQILKQTKSKMKEINVPEWGGSVFIKVMSVGERDRYENEWQHARGHGGYQNFSTKFLIRCICEEDGTLLFTDADIEKLKNLPADAMRHLWDEAMSLNKLKSEDVEELAKN